MVKGIDIFRERFRPFTGAFILIGGAACDEWFTRLDLTFRSTKDLDIVLLVEVIDSSFVSAIRSFVREGGYELRERSETDKSPVLYRFSKPANPTFPAMLEFFSRTPDGFDLAEGQTIIPIASESERHSLSAILLDQAYYDLIRGQSLAVDGVNFATLAALIPLKARAWLDLTARRETGEHIDCKNIDKHRTDVFRLAATLPGEPGPDLPSSILADLSAFLAGFPTTSAEWPAISASLNAMNLRVHPAALIAVLKTYFRLPTA